MKTIMLLFAENAVILPKFIFVFPERYLAQSNYRKDQFGKN